MVKAKTAGKKAQNQISRRSNPTFGAVSTITTAPVAIGNSIRGIAPRVTQIADGVRIVGRDFGTQVNSTVAAVVDWTLVAGFPVTPACFPSSILRNYTQMYCKFKVIELQVHYITASATSQTGDVMFYYERDHTAPSPDFTNSSFLPYILSDSHTVIGPQWTNHTLFVKPTDDWNTTNYGMSADLNGDTAGSVFIYSKTSTANSPGYLVFDYVIQFKELAVNPRAGLLPVSRAQWNYLTLGLTTTAVTANTTTTIPAIQGNEPDGTVTAVPAGTATGDIFKLVFLVTASTASGVNAAWTNVTAANLLVFNAGGTTTAVTIDDGFTCYGTYTSGTMRLYPTYTNALAVSNTFFYGVTATITFNLCCMASVVGFINANTQSSY